MRVGTPTETKIAERRVGLTPGSVHELVAHGHEVLVQRGAGAGIGAGDEEYAAAGATLVDTAEDLFARAELIVKVKEPQAPERAMLRPGHVLFTYLHLAPDPEQATDLVASGATCIAYETVTDDHGRLPLLAPMSKVAGRMAVQAGAHCLESAHGGAGILLGGVPGVPPGRVVVIGGGVVGENAIQMALGLGADVTVLDRSHDVLDRLAARFGAALTTVYSTRAALEALVVDADLVIGAVLVPGARAPHLVTAEMIKRMRPGSVVVDVAIDQGGCFETSHPTTHTDPTYVVHDVVHYCVANMPGAVARTSAHALNNVTLPHVIALADHGVHEALRRDPHLRDGLNVHAGHITDEAVADALGTEYVPAEDALGAVVASLVVGVDEAIERAVARLDPEARVEAWAELPGGTSACVCRVDLRTAAGNTRRVVFRQHRAEFKGHGHGVAAVEHGVLTALWRRGFEVPEPHLLDDGGGAVAPFLVTDWIDGTTEVDPAQLPAALAQMADFLARLHALDPTEIDVAGLEDLEDPALALPALLPADRAGDRLREALAAGEITHDRVAPVLLHGDYWPGNVMWRHGRLVAVVDWEDVRIGDPLADLACARVELLCGYGPEAMDSFTEQYLERCAAADLEIALTGLPLWEVYVSAAALVSMGAWGLDPDEESRRRRATQGFLDRATADLLDD